MSIVAQTTLAHDVSYNGIGLHAANEVHMVLRRPDKDNACISRSRAQYHMNFIRSMQADTVI